MLLFLKVFITAFIAEMGDKTQLTAITFCANEGLLNTLAFVIFYVFGVFTLYQGLKLINAGISSIPVLPILIVATIVFAGICVDLFIKREKKAKAAN